MTSKILTTSDLSVEIAGQLICSGLSMEIQADQVWGILGCNGVGKTTLLHTLAGLRAPRGGSVDLLGVNLAEQSRRLIAKQLGILFQQQHEPFPNKVLETVLSGRHPYLGAWRWESEEDISRAVEALRLLELDHLQQRSINTLSGGEWQRLKLATLLTQNPLLMLLDEPTNHLDLHYQIKLVRLLVEQNQRNQGAILMTLHDLNLAARFCNHILLLSPARSPLYGKTEDIMQPELLSEAFNYPIARLEYGKQPVFIPL